MHGLLAKFLNKRGVDNADKLNNEKLIDGSESERETFIKWEKILSINKELVTTKEIEKFCRREMSRIEEKWETDSDPKLISYHVVYKKIINCISAPNKEREQLELYLINLIK